MRAKKAGRLTKRDYYSPVAIIAADIKGLITDFNVFAQVLFMPFVEGAKNKPLVDFLDNVCPGCGLRSVLASAVDPSGEVMAAKRSANRKDDPQEAYSNPGRAISFFEIWLSGPTPYGPGPSRYKFGRIHGDDPLLRAGKD